MPEHDRERGPGYDVAVVLPTRDRPAQLRRALEALRAQRGVDRVQLIVANDGRAALESMVDVHVVRTGGGRGVAVARNAGARAARAPLVAFTDDDCEPASDWLARLRDSIGEAAASGGRTVNGRSRSVWAEASERVVEGAYAAWNRGPGGARSLVGNNIMVRLEWLVAEPFDESFAAPEGAEDRAWCARLRAHGAHLTWVPEAVVHHHRGGGARAFLRQAWRNGRGAALVRRIEGPERARLRAPGFYARLVASGLHAERPLRVAALIAVAQVVTAASFAATVAVQAVAGRRPHAPGMVGGEPAA